MTLIRPVHGRRRLGRMTRTRIALTLTTLGLAGLLGLTGCGGAAPAGAPAAPAVDVADEARALTAVGLTTGLAEADPAPSGSAPAGREGKARHPGMRKFLRKNTLHGEMTVQGKKGVRTVVVQRGSVTAVDATTVSVKSADGFSQTWTFGDKLRVVQHRKTVGTTAIKPGAEIGIAGAKDGDRNVARLVAIA
jgi:hypothetical protein